MDDTDCTAFLQWALPRLELRWLGYRKVRRQVCERLRKRMSELGVTDFAAYRLLLAADQAEWQALDECCHITISRFFRDRGIFEALRSRVLPDIAGRANREQRPARVWCAGCAAGEEAYTLTILWHLEVARAYSDVRLTVFATDIDEAMLARAQEGCFKATSLHELPPHLIEQAFERRGGFSASSPCFAKASSSYIRTCGRRHRRRCSISSSAGTSPSPILRPLCSGRFWTALSTGCCRMATK